MKSYREELWFETKTRRAYLNITEQVETVVKKSGVQEARAGECHAYHGQRLY